MPHLSKFSNVEPVVINGREEGVVAQIGLDLHPGIAQPCAQRRVDRLRELDDDVLKLAGVDEVTERPRRFNRRHHRRRRACNGSPADLLSPRSGRQRQYADPDGQDFAPTATDEASMP